MIKPYTQISDHFNYRDATYSATAEGRRINNEPPEHIYKVILQTATKMEAIRSLLHNSPIHVSSWYRSPVLNEIKSKSSKSQHLTGEAVDWVSPLYGSPLAICKTLVLNKDLIQFDQLILEHTWVHISFAILTGKPRLQVLSSLANGSYANGLTNDKGMPYD